MTGEASGAVVSSVALAQRPLTPEGDVAPPSTTRTRAYASARRHSRAVRFLKVAIPVGSALAAGLILLVTIFNPFGRMPGLQLGPVSLSGTKVAMENPRLTGFRNKDGRPYEVTATAAYQDIRKPNLIELKDMRAQLTMDQSGTLARLVATGGLFDTTKEHLDLSQDIRITTDRGDEVFLRSASIDLKAGSMTSSDGVRIRTPSGTIEADGVQVSDSGHTIVFTGRVRTQFFRSASELGGPPKPASAGVGGTAPAIPMSAAASAKPSSPQISQADPVSR